MWLCDQSLFLRWSPVADACENKRYVWSGIISNDFRMKPLWVEQVSHFPDPNVRPNLQDGTLFITMQYPSWVGRANMPIDSKKLVDKSFESKILITSYILN